MSLAVLSLSLVAGFHSWIGRRISHFDATRVPRLEPSAITLVPGVHLLGGLSPSAAYAVETPRGLVLVDSGLSPDAGLLRSQLAELKLDRSQPCAILLTHVHGDHTGGAEAIRSASGAKVYAGRGDATVLAAGGPREAFFSTFFMPDDSPHPTTVDVALKGGEILDFGGVRFRAIAAPGHTPGSICYLMERDGLRALFAGDVISMIHGNEAAHTELLKPLGTYSAYLSPRYRGDARTYIRTLRALRALPVPDLVLPGHPRSDPTPQSPCLSQTQWDAMMDRGLREMETLVARYETDGANFLDGIPKQLLPNLFYLGNHGNAAVYGFFVRSKFYLVDAPGGPGLARFVGKQLACLGQTPTAPTAVLLTSTMPAATAGLPELIETWHPQVVVSTEGADALKSCCPDCTQIVPANELRSKDWFDAVAVPLRARSGSPMAYSLSWAGKTVLFTGRVVITTNHDAVAARAAEIAASRDDAVDYLTSVNRLADLNPNLWLPAVPTDDQNANLYDDDWQNIIADNYAVGDAHLQTR